MSERLLTTELEGGDTYEALPSRPLNDSERLIKAFFRAHDDPAWADPEISPPLTASSDTVVVEEYSPKI